MSGSGDNKKDTPQKGRDVPTARSQLSGKKQGEQFLAAAQYAQRLKEENLANRPVFSQNELEAAARAGVDLEGHRQKAKDVSVFMLRPEWHESKEGILTRYGLYPDDAASALTEIEEIDKNVYAAKVENIGEAIRKTNKKHGLDAIDDINNKYVHRAIRQIEDVDGFAYEDKKGVLIKYGIRDINEIPLVIELLKREKDTDSISDSSSDSEIPEPQQKRRRTEEDPQDKGKGKGKELQEPRPLQEQRRIRGTEEAPEHHSQPQARGAEALPPQDAEDAAKQIGDKSKRFINSILSLETRNRIANELAKNNAWDRNAYELVHRIPVMGLEGYRGTVKFSQEIQNMSISEFASELMSLLRQKVDNNSSLFREIDRYHKQAGLE
jgi:hypothetical protein